MAPQGDAGLLALAREIRGLESLEADPTVLEEIRDFMLAHEADNARTASHNVLENYPDWWTRGRRAPVGLQFEQEELDQLFRHAGTLYGLGIPLTIAERRTPSFRLFQDIEAWGSRDAAVGLEQMIGPDCELARLIGKIMGEVFPGRDFLDAAVYDATGMSQTKGIKKTSLRLVWPGLVVDSDRAARIRDLLVHKLTAASAAGGPIADLEALLREHSNQNAWHSVFGDAAYGSRSSVRMVLSDRVSPLPLRAPEKRPFAPVGVLRFSFIDGKMKIEWLCSQAELDNSEWLKIGSLRQGDGTALTEWTAPSGPGGASAPATGLRTGRVKVRTAGGSDGGGGLRLRPAATKAAPERAGQLLTVERRFLGSVDQFCAKMEEHLGKATVEEDGTYVWKQPGGDARIAMHADDKRVKVIGRTNQVRSLVVIVSPFTEAQPTLGATERPAGPPLPDGRAPSAAYAPERPETGQVATEESTVQSTPSAEVNTEEVNGQTRVAAQDFEAQDESELGLTQGEFVVITHDPEADQANAEDRWAYGRRETNGQVGWFPLSHTKPA